MPLGSRSYGSAMAAVPSRARRRWRCGRGRSPPNVATSSTDAFAPAARRPIPTHVAALGPGAATLPGARPPPGLLQQPRALLSPSRSAVRTEAESGRDMPPRPFPLERRTNHFPGSAQSIRRGVANPIGINAVRRSTRDAATPTLDPRPSASRPDHVSPGGALPGGSGAPSIAPAPAREAMRSLGLRDHARQYGPRGGGHRPAGSG